MNQDDVNRQFHRDQVARLASRRNALPASSHVRAAITDDLLDRLRDKIEKAGTAADLDWCKWPMIFGFTENVSDDAVALLDEDIDLILAATSSDRWSPTTDFLKTCELNHPGRWFGGLFDLWAKATLLRRARDVQFDAVLQNGRNRDAVATTNGRRFSFEFTVITEDDESRAVWGSLHGSQEDRSHKGARAPRSI